MIGEAVNRGAVLGGGELTEGQYSGETVNRGALWGDVVKD